VAARLPRVISSWGENLFQPGLSCVLCAEAPGTRSKDRPTKNPASSRCARRIRRSRLAILLSVPDFGLRMLTSISENACEEGWHFSLKGYFSTRWATKEKPGWRTTRAGFRVGKTKKSLNVPSAAWAPAKASPLEYPQPSRLLREQFAREQPPPACAPGSPGFH